LKAAANPNIASMFFTAFVFQLPMSPLNRVACKNIFCMSVTADVAQFPMFWLNAIAD